MRDGGGLVTKGRQCETQSNSYNPVATVCAMDSEAARRGGITTLRLHSGKTKTAEGHAINREQL